MTKDVTMIYLLTVLYVGVLSCTYIYSNNLIILRNCNYILIAYCITDIRGNTLEMIIHHVATILLGYSIHNASYRDLTLEQNNLLTDYTTVLLQTEISSIPLNLIHLGYKNKYTKVIFISTFFYFRMVKVPEILIFNPDTCFYCQYETHPIEIVFSDSLFCYYSWVFSTLALLSLNCIWMVKIVRKIL